MGEKIFLNGNVLYDAKEEKTKKKKKTQKTMKIHQINFFCVINDESV